MSASNPTQSFVPEDDEEELLNADDAAEEIQHDDNHPMENEDDEGDDLAEEIQLQNDSVAHFDSHTDSIFCIAQHPLRPSLIATGGGDDVAYLFDSTVTKNEPGPVLPTSYESNPQPKGERKSIPPLQKLDGHTDSVNAIAFSQPLGEHIITAGLDGKLRVWFSTSPPSESSPSPPTYTYLAEASEVEEINWLSPCPSVSHPNTFAFGANDGSVWVYTINAADVYSPLTINQAYYLHTESCTAGAWTSDGNLLATVSEDSSLHVYDVWGTAADTGITTAGSGQAIISLTASDQRFAVDGGLYCIAISPNDTLAAVGGAGGNMRIVGLPRLSSKETTTAATAKTTKSSSHSKAATSSTTSSSPATNPLLASLTPQSDNIETLTFSQPPLTLLAAGSVDGSIAILDVAHRFALRRHIADAHDGFAVVQLQFSAQHLLSAGMDGVLRRWDARSGSASGVAVREWKGHRGDGEGGGVLGFVQVGAVGEGEEDVGRDGGVASIVTAGDDGVALVFRARGD